MKQWESRARLAMAIIGRRGLKGLLDVARAAYSLGAEPEVVPGGPLYVQVEPTVHCNLACSMCDNPFLTRKAKYMTLDQFNNILDQIPGLAKMSLVGVGEPILNPDIFDMIAAARSRGIEIGLATNGTLLTDERIRELLAVDPRWINVSLDGATAETFETIREGAVFEELLERIRKLVQAVGSRATPKLSVWFVGMKQNIHELPDLVRLVKDLGISTLCLQTIHFWGKPEWEERIGSETLAIHPELADKWISKAQRVAQSLGVELEYVNLPDPSGGRACQWPWRAAYVSVDGFVTPCCMHGTDPQVINFGNLSQESFREIWNNQDYRRFRREMKSDEPPEICRNCPSYYPIRKIS
ncbi:radical SAM protein [Nitrospinae bacterium AH_259_B05_G02_I21]|nr:radical SAM protein [Nitrospinae bacterium AH_259_B05_G02_I21]MDA2931639.1 radical SAM protein [Nitrospinae bacterium AH-259-F20]